MVIDTNSDFIENVENMGPQMKGTIKVMKKGENTVGFGFITAEDGRDYFFSPFSLPSYNPDNKGPEQTFALREEFSNIPENAKVTFNVVNTRKGPEAHNVMLDTSGEAQTIVPKIEDAVAEILADSPECSLEDEAFRIDSMGWKETVLEDSTGALIHAKVNSEGDVWELHNGEQLFTPVSMDRETKKVGREQDIMTEKQAHWLLKNTPNNIPEGCKFAGFLNSKDGKIHYNQENACYWIGETNEKGNQKALFCIDISTVDEEMRPYTDEMVISDYDINSAMQVRLLKKKNKAILQLGEESEEYLKWYIEKFNSIKEAQKAQ